MFRLAGVFGNNMVLQRETDAAVWGYAKPGATVTIKPTWSEEAVTTTANEDGKWKTTIATPEAGGPFQIGFHSNNYKINLKNVMSGEVWICSGQSNMQWRMRGFGLKHFQAAVEKANQPNIRLGYVPQVLSLEPQEDIRVGWTACSPKTVLQFSAVAYFFANKLDQELDGVPIGLVSTNWGGSAAEAWVEKEALLEGLKVLILRGLWGGEFEPSVFTTSDLYIYASPTLCFFFYLFLTEARDLSIA